MKKKYITPITEAVRVDTSAILEISDVKPAGPGSGGIFGGDGNEKDNPLDAKENNWGDIWED